MQWIKIGNTYINLESVIYIDFADDTAFVEFENGVSHDISDEQELMDLASIMDSLTGHADD